MACITCEYCRYWNESDNRGTETGGTFQAACEFWKFEGVRKYTSPEDSCEKGEPIEN